MKAPLSTTSTSPDLAQLARSNPASDRVGVYPLARVRFADLGGELIEVSRRGGQCVLAREFGA